MIILAAVAIMVFFTIWSGNDHEDTIFIILKIFLTYIQMSSIAGLFEVPWPSAVFDPIFTIQEHLQRVDRLISTECLLPHSGIGVGIQIRGYLLLLPIFFTLAAFLFWLLWWLVSAVICRKARHEEIWVHLKQMSTEHDTRGMEDELQYVFDELVYSVAQALGIHLENYEVANNEPIIIHASSTSDPSNQVSTYPPISRVRSAIWSSE